MADLYVEAFVGHSEITGHSRDDAPTGDLVWNEQRGVYTVGETDRYWVDIIPMLFNHRVVLTPKRAPETYDVGWCYPSLLAAYAAVVAWQPGVDPEPVGYIKRIGEVVEL